MSGLTFLTLSGMVLALASWYFHDPLLLVLAVLALMFRLALGASIAGLTTVLLIFAVVGAVSACQIEAEQLSESDGKWTYVTGPNGEQCLLLSYELGTRYGVAGMHCDRVNPPQP